MLRPFPLNQLEQIPEICLILSLHFVHLSFSADFGVCLFSSRDGSLQLRLRVAFHLTLVVSFVACICIEQHSRPKTNSPLGHLGSGV